MTAGWCSMHMPPSETAADSMSGQYPYREDSNSPDSCSAAVPSSPQLGGRGAASKNMVMERDRRRRLNEKLYALRSVVPNITKVQSSPFLN